MNRPINPFARASADVPRAPADPAAYKVAQAERQTPLVFACPHSGRHYPRDLDANIDLFNLRRLEDTDVDRLLEETPQHGATLVTGAYGRAYLDLNRSPDDLDPAMFDRSIAHGNPPNARIAAGLGLFTRYAAGGREIYDRKLSLDEAKRRISTVHAPYHAELAKALDRAQTAFGGAVLIDWHSMPSLAAYSGEGAGRRAVDVVLGDRYGRSCRPKLIAFAESTFQSLGLSTARNSPYAGGYTTEHYGRPNENRQALQIELNRGLYLDEASLDRARNFSALRTVITEFTIRLVTSVDDLMV